MQDQPAGVSITLRSLLFLFPKAPENFVSPSTSLETNWLYTTSLINNKNLLTVRVTSIDHYSLPFVS